MNPTDATQPLVQLGLSELEAEVYVYLLQQPASTGYGIAQGIGRLPANVYQALRSLAKKGAVLIEQGASKTCRAIPADEFLAMLSSQFEQRQRQAKKLLKKVESGQRDDRIYVLTQVEQVYERCRQMLQSATRTVVIDLFPQPLRILGPHLEECAKRGVLVQAKGYLPVELDGVRVWMNPEGQRYVDHMPADLLVLVVDGREMLTAGISKDGKKVAQAIWTSSPMLAFLYHTSIAAEIELTATMSLLAGMTDIKDLTTLLQPMRHMITPVTDEDLATRYERFLLLYRQLPGAKEFVKEVSTDE